MDRTSNPQYANAIRDARRSKGLTQVRLAKMLGVTSIYISYIENGKDKPSFKLIEKMADKLNLRFTLKFEEWGK